MVEFKLFIPCAGVGSRLENITKNLNKALVSINDMAAISHIINKAHIDLEIVIALGYQGDRLRDFLELAHPGRKFTFVEIDKYEGEGSGLGYTMIKCKDYLQCPFMFISNDTLIENNFVIYNEGYTENIMGISDKAKTGKYRSITLDLKSHKYGKYHVVKDVLEEQTHESCPYIGMAVIADYVDFWEILEELVKKDPTYGEAHALKLLAKKRDIKVQNLDWYDTGNTFELQCTRDKLETNEHYTLDKDNENIWIYPNRVIKFSEDPNFISSRVERAKKLEGFVPKIEEKRDNFYSYKKILGPTLSREITPELFRDLLTWLELEFWKPVQCDNFPELCKEFYFNKTIKRTDEYLQEYKEDTETTINGELVPPIDVLLTDIRWEKLFNGIPVRWHGDLHFENIILQDTYGNKELNKFVLIDWRQDFAGNLDCGDIYYDLAKLYHGLLISHEQVAFNNFSIEKSANNVTLDIKIPFKLFSCIPVFEEWVQGQGYDLNKIKLLTYIVLLNMASLHWKPYDQFLFYFAKLGLKNVCYSM